MMRTENGYLGENGKLLPLFVTFTGVGAETDLDRLAALDHRYPIEWGVLFSPTRQGQDPRYPDEAVVRRLIDRARQKPMRLAAHLCGDYARKVIEEVRLGIEDLLSGNFGRFQVNTPKDVLGPNVVRDFAEAMNPVGTGILQCRDPMVFPSTWGVDWLYDRSGGRGEPPQRWPVPSHDGPFVGYAGGLSPLTVADSLARIQETHPIDRSYWIDMETQIRTDDRLDLDKCEAVCRAVYGDNAGDATT